MFKIWPFAKPGPDPEPPPPYQTAQMKSSGVVWSRIQGNWYMVCGFCGGNCGQCGMTGYVDNVPADMQNMINNMIGKI